MLQRTGHYGAVAIRVGVQVSRLLHVPSEHRKESILLADCSFIATEPSGERFTLGDHENIAAHSKKKDPPIPPL